MFEFHDIEQNSDLWFDMRGGKLTSSNLGKIMANYGKAFGEPAKKLAATIAAQQLGAEVLSNSFSNEHMDRGHQQEPLARMLYENETFWDVTNGGFFSSDFKFIEVEFPFEAVFILFDSVMDKAFAEFSGNDEINRKHLYNLRRNLRAVLLDCVYWGMGTPHFFYIIEFANFRAEEMYDDIACIHYDPIRIICAFDAYFLYAAHI